MREYTGPTADVHRVAFVPGDPPRLAAAAHRDVFLWDLPRAEPVFQMGYRSDQGDGPSHLAVSPDGRWLVVGPPEDPIVYDLSSLSEAAAPSFEPGLLFVGFDEPDRMMAVVRSAGDGRPRLYRTDRPLIGAGGAPAEQVAFGLTAELEPHVAGLNAGGFWDVVALSADGSRFALAAGRLPVAFVWDTAAGALLPTIRVRRQPNGLALSPDGARLAVDAGTTVYVYDVPTAELVTKWKTKYSYVPQLAWSPDGRLLGRTDHSTTTRLYEAETGREVSALGTKRGRATAIAFAPDGLTFATGTSNCTVRVWDVEG